MALSLKIAGVDFTQNYVNGSSQITNMIQNQGDSFTFNLVVKSGQQLPYIGAPITFKDGSRVLFGGYVSKLTPTEYGVGNVIEYQCEATDFTYIASNKTAQAGYQGQTLSHIVNDLVTRSIDAGYGLSTAGVETGPVIANITFNHITIRAAFEKIAKITNYIWWIDYTGVIHFINPANAAPAPEKVTDSSRNIQQGLAIYSDTSQVKNDVIMSGGIQESSDFTQVIKGDGNARAWSLPYAVFNMIAFDLNGVAQTIGIDQVDSDTGNYAMYTPSTGAIRLTATSTTPGTSDILNVVYTYGFPVLVEVQDAVSIAFMKALEGGDGIHSYNLNDSTISSQAQARQMAQSELNAWSYPILTGQFVTRTGLLQAGSYWSAGSAITVNFPSYGISTDTVFIIQKVVTTLIEGAGGAIEYTYDVTFGGRQLGVVDFLIALAEPEVPIDDGAQVTLIHAVSEILTLSEIVTRDGNKKTVSETGTIVEAAPTIVLTTPPFNWQAAGAKPAIWNLFQWG